MEITNLNFTTGLEKPQGRQLDDAGKLDRVSSAEEKTDLRKLERLTQGSSVLARQ